MRVGLVVAVCGLLGLTGCSGCSGGSGSVPISDVALMGTAYSGQRPIAGAHVYLFAAGSTGYGQASVSLVSAEETGKSDSLGAYVTTGSNGDFSLTGDYPCDSGQQLYLYVLAGNSGVGANTAAGLMAAIGELPGEFGLGNFGDGE